VNQSRPRERRTVRAARKLFTFSLRREQPEARQARVPERQPSEHQEPELAVVARERQLLEVQVLALERVPELLILFPFLWFRSLLQVCLLSQESSPFWFLFWFPWRTREPYRNPRRRARRPLQQSLEVFS
jgi:hypothetical protein